jgi:hypothetical protein
MSSVHVSPADAVLLAEQAFTFAYPLVMAGSAPALNELSFERDRPDSLRVSGRLDLAEPVVLVTPDTQGRYFVLWLRDAWNEVFATIGARTTGTARRAFVLHHGAASLPPRLMPLEAPTRLVSVGGCIEAVADPDAEVLAARPSVVALSRRRRGSIQETQPETGAKGFFAAFWRLAGDNPPPVADREALRRLRAIAPRSGRLDPGLRAALEAGVRRGQGMVRAAAELALGEPAGGWRVSYASGRYGSDHLRRAAMLHAGFAADPAADVLTAVRERDEQGAALDGGERYLLRFTPDGAPPVHGFWSLTAGEHALSDLHGLRADTDGSIPILISHRPPARRHRSNWLPAPDGGFRLELRLYWPREEALERRWTPPALTRLMRSG